MQSENDIEKTLQDKGLNAPRLSPKDIDKVIDYVRYDRLTNTDVTVCTITLRNGFTTTGIDHGPVSDENFDAEMGKKMAYEKARAEIWPLEGYLLAQKLYEESMRTAMDNDGIPF